MLDWRPQFKTVKHFADALINVWNEFTEEDSIVFIVGDLGAYCKDTMEVLHALKGKKVLLLGNHDVIWGRHFWECDAFMGVYRELTMNGIHIQHIPDEVDEPFDYYIHGHHHRYDMPGMYKALQRYAVDTVRFNCSADINGFKPCTLQQLILNKELLLDKLIV